MLGSESAVGAPVEVMVCRWWLEKGWDSNEVAMMSRDCDRS